MIGSVRTLMVPYNGAGSRKRIYQKVSTVAVKKRSGGKPNIDITSPMPLSLPEFDNVSLATLGEMGNPQAREEILKRHVMRTDKVSYETASEKVEEIAATNRRGVFLLSLPYQIGIAAR
jgi:hypothetical protein